MLLGLLDLPAAFDTVDYEILINRLQTSYPQESAIMDIILHFPMYSNCKFYRETVNKISSCLSRTTRKRPRACVVSAV